MSAEPLIAIDELLGPQSDSGSENGEASPDQSALESDRMKLKEKLWHVRDKIKEDRREEDRNTGEVRRVNWKAIHELAEQTLREPHKDMQVAAYLTEALVVQHGFAGLRDALQLMRRFTEDRWDRLISPFEGDDPQVVAALEWLDDPEAGGRFPNRVRGAPLLRGKFSYLDWKPNERGQLPENRVEFEKAAAAATFEECDQAATLVSSCLDELQLLSDGLVTRLGREAAPGMTGLRKALEDCRHLIQDIMKDKQPATASAAGDGTSGAGSGGGTNTSFTTSREAIYQQLRLAADALQRLEPHSPVPYLVKRAVELGALPFHAMIRALIRDANVLDELSRELGIKQESPPESSSE